MENEEKKAPAYEIGTLVKINKNFQPWDLQYVVRDVPGVIEDVYTTYKQPVYLVNFTDKKIKQKCFESWIDPVTDDEIIKREMNIKVVIPKGKLMEIITDAALSILDTVGVQIAEYEEEVNEEGNV